MFNKIKLKDHEDEMKTLIYFIKTRLDLSEINKMSVNDIYSAYEKYNQIGIEDGWLSPNEVWLKKLKNFK